MEVVGLVTVVAGLVEVLVDVEVVGLVTVVAGLVEVLVEVEVVGLVTVVAGLVEVLVEVEVVGLVTVDELWPDVISEGRVTVLWLVLLCEGAVFVPGRAWLLLGGVTLWLLSCVYPGLVLAGRVFDGRADMPTV